MKRLNLWQQYEIVNNIDTDSISPSLHFEKGIDSRLRLEIIALFRWLRKTYIFPEKLHVYLVDSYKIRLMNGIMAYGSFKYFDNSSPRIKVPIKLTDDDLFNLYNSFDSVMSSIIHELTHYYQYESDISFDMFDSISERQANYYRYRILDKFYRSTGRTDYYLFE